MEKLEHLYTAGENINGTGDLENSLAVVQMLWLSYEPRYIPKINENLHQQKVIHECSQHHFS